MKKFMVEENKVKLRVDVFLDNFEKKKRSISVNLNPIHSRFTTINRTLK